MFYCQILKNTKTNIYVMASSKKTPSLKMSGQLRFAQNWLYLQKLHVYIIYIIKIYIYACSILHAKKKKKKDLGLYHFKIVLLNW